MDVRFLKNLLARVAVMGCTILIVACGGDDEPQTKEPVNALPIAEAGDGGAASSGQSVTLDGGGSRDPEGGALAYSWTQQTGQPQATLQGANSRRVTITAPAVTEETVLTFTLTVTDPAGQTASDTVQITVSPIVGATDLRIMSKPETGDTYDTNEVIIVEVAFSGVVVVNGDRPALALNIGSGTGMARYALGNNTNTLTFRYGIRLGDEDTDGIGIAANALRASPGSIVDDNGYAANVDLDGHAITGDANHKISGGQAEMAPPTANAGSDREVLEGTTATLDASASKGPGGFLHYAWTQAAGGERVTLADANQARTAFTLPDVSDRAKIIFTLTVTDDLGRTSTDEVAIKVLFEPWDNLWSQCENPRTGVDANGDSFPDVPGTALDEKNFLRSYTNDTYLWYDEVDYLDPTDEQYSIADYFARLKTFARTPSGKLRDEFHFTYPTEQYLELTQSGTSLSYGFEAAAIDGEVFVLHTELGSPADDNDLSRGVRIVSVDGRTYTGGQMVDFLYPRDRTAYEYTFEVRDLGATATRTFRMQATEVTSDPVRYTRVIETDTGPVGYLLFNDHNQPSEIQLIEAFEELAEAEVTDLVLDLRYNSGGYVAVANEVAFMIAGAAATSGKVFDRSQFNDKHPTIHPLFGRPIGAGLFLSTAVGFTAEAGAPLPSLNLSRVFILATDGTCSASESIINGLRGIDIEVILIGDTTCGKPYGFYAVGNCGTTYFTVQLRASNNKGFGDYADGFSPQNTTGTEGISVPGCAVADDPEHALGDVDEALLKAALQYRGDGSCPTPSRVAARRLAVGDTLQNIGIIMTQ